MTRCVSFYRKCERDGFNWCGKDHDTIQLIKNYIKLLKELENLGVPWESTIVELPETPARPLFDKRNSDIQEKALVSIAESLKTHKNPLNGVFLKKWTSSNVNKLLLKLRRDIEPANTVAVNSSFLVNVIECEIKDAQKHVAKDDVDLILTDPPYGEDFLDCWDALGEFANYALKDGGVLATYSGKTHIPSVLKSLLSKHLNYLWTCVVLHTGSYARIHPLHFDTGWKPLILFVKGKYKPRDELFTDIIIGTGREKALNDWAQADGESEKIIEYFTKEGEFVVDPFVGSGTTILAAKRLNRKFLGMDKDAQAVKTALGRLSLDA